MENSSGQTPPPPPTQKKLGDWIGWVIGGIGILVAIYAIWDARKEPELSYSINSHRTAILQKGNLTDLKVAFRDFTVTGDVSSVQIQILNTGKQAIKFSDILSPVMINFRDNVFCYQVNATQNRDVINACLFPHVEPWISINRTNRIRGTEASGISGKDGYQLTWDILEKGDVIKLEVIYGGDINEPVSVKGIVEGQREGITEAETPESNPRNWSNWGNFFFVCAIILVFSSAYRDLQTFIIKGKRDAITSFVALSDVVVIVGALYVIYTIMSR
jgi:hypothetical protein